ncbi:MAG: zinc dependent phospholipase C family protein, partial [Pseudomonadota bacterium]
MNLLYKILYAAHASGTHHKIALRALAEIKAPEAERWRRVFLAHAVDFMEGAKAPDKDFKDFQNHVLHPGHGHGPDWGGAAEAAEDWYANTVDALRRGAFADAAYSAGVLSHYYSDVWMPLHTASSEEETVIHRALEWSASRAFEQLWAERPRVEVVIEPTPDWLTRMVRHAAYSSNASYDALIQGYDFDVGAKRPAEGLTRPARLICARMLSAAVAGVARIYDRALAEAGGAPPNVDLTVSTALAGLGAPISRVLAKIEDLGARAEVARIHRELRVTGGVESALPLEQRIVRGLSPRRRFGPDAAELGPTVAPPSAADAAPRRDPAAGRASGLARAAQGADALIREPAFEKTALDHALQRAILATPVSAAAERAAPPATLRAD